MPVRRLGEPILMANTLLGGCNRLLITQCRCLYVSDGDQQAFQILAMLTLCKPQAVTTA